MSLGSRRVYTTFAVGFEAFRESKSELLKERFLAGGGFGDAAQADFAAIGGRQNNIGALQSGPQRQSLHGE